MRKPKTIREAESLSETLIQRQILDYLERRHIFAWRNNTRVVYMQGRPIQFGYPGSSDILGVWKGRFLAIEVKRRKGVRRPNQVAFQQRVREAGGIAIFAESVEDVIQNLEGGGEHGTVFPN